MTMEGILCASSIMMTMLETTKQNKIIMMTIWGCLLGTLKEVKGLTGTILIMQFFSLCLHNNCDFMLDVLTQLPFGLDLFKSTLSGVRLLTR